MATRRRRSGRENLRVAATIAGLVLLMVGALVVATYVVDRSFRVDDDDAASDVGRAGSPQVAAPDLPLSSDQLASGLVYVALGDSYAAGPGLPEQVGEPAACQRSSNNYPTILAGLLRTSSFVDASCTGATDDDLTGVQVRPDGTEVPPQVDALDETTDLVTLSLGGNVRGLVERLIDRCTELGPQDPRGHPCQDAFGGPVDNQLYDDARALQQNIVDAVAAIRDSAPQAQVVVVGYPQLFPTGTNCTQLPFAWGDATFAAGVVELTDRSLRLAARSEGVRYVDLLEPSEGHDICSDDPWVVGAQPSPGGATAYHLELAGMQGLADVVHRQLTGSEAP